MALFLLPNWEGWVEVPGWGLTPPTSFLPPASSDLAIPGCFPPLCSQLPLYTLTPHLSASSSLCSLPAPSLWGGTPLSPSLWSPHTLVSPFPLLSVSPLRVTTSLHPLGWAPASCGALSDLQGGQGGGGGRLVAASQGLGAVSKGWPTFSPDINRIFISS